MTYQKILFVGCGNMAGAMLDGWLACGMSPGAFTVFDPSPKTLPEGVTVLTEMPDAKITGGEFDAVLLGVKPQMLADVAPQVEPLVGPGTTLLSILAGVQLATLAKRFPRAGAVVRVMPNLAVSLGKSPVGLAASGLDAAGQDALKTFMDPLGTPAWIGEEQFDLFTALAGSGPAFVYRFISALAQAAAELGLEDDRATQIATAMVEGAAALAAASPDDPGALADKVASPGGTTRAGLDVMDEDAAIVSLMQATLRAARDRSVEMAAETAG